MRLSRVAIVMALLFAGTSTLWGQTITRGEMIKASATIQAIDATNRVITFKGDDGEVDLVWAPPELTRFNELKVGDRVNLTYYASVVLQLRRAGATSLKPSDETAVVPTGTTLPGGAASRQVTTSVTVKSIDPAVPSITVTTADGRAVTGKVAQKSNLEGVKPGDRIDITYTEAVLANVERAEK